MEDSEIHSLVKTTVREAVKISHSELLRDIGSMIQQISSPASSSLNSSTYHSVLDAPKFKRRSNVEQFKQNSKVMAKLDLAESHIEKQNIADAKESIIEGKLVKLYCLKFYIWGLVNDLDVKHHGNGCRMLGVVMAELHLFSSSETF